MVIKYKSKHTGAQIDEAVSKVLNGEVGGGATPDWNAQEGEAGYIENRTHYSKLDVLFDETYNMHYSNGIWIYVNKYEDLPNVEFIIEYYLKNEVSEDVISGSYKTGRPSMGNQYIIDADDNGYVKLSCMEDEGPCAFYFSSF